MSHFNISIIIERIQIEKRCCSKFFKHEAGIKIALVTRLPLSVLQMPDINKLLHSQVRLLSVY